MPTRSSPISISASAPPGLDFNQDPPQGIAEAVFAPDRVDATLVDRLLSKCGDNLHLLAAPATLDRALRLRRDRVRFARSTRCAPRRRGSCSTCRTPGRLDAAHADRRRRGHHRRRARSRQPAQRQEHHRQHSRRAAQRPSAAPDPQRRRHAEAAGNLASPISPRRSRSEPIAVIPHDAKLFGAAANNGQMIAEIEPKGKTAETFGELAARASPDAPRSRKRQARPVRSASGQAVAQEGVIARRAPRRCGRIVRRQGNRACSVSAPIPDSASPAPAAAAAAARRRASAEPSAAPQPAAVARDRRDRRSRSGARTAISRPSR